MVHKFKQDLSLPMCPWPHSLLLSPLSANLLGLLTVVWKCQAHSCLRVFVFTASSACDVYCPHVTWLNPPSHSVVHRGLSWAPYLCCSLNISGYPCTLALILLFTGPPIPKALTIVWTWCCLPTSLSPLPESKLNESKEAALLSSLLDPLHLANRKHFIHMWLVSEWKTLWGPEVGWCSGQQHVSGDSGFILLCVG